MKKNTKNYLISGLVFGAALAGSLYYTNTQNVAAANTPTQPTQNQNGGMCMACPAKFAITSISEEGQPTCEQVQDDPGSDPSGTKPGGNTPAPVVTPPTGTTNSTPGTSTTVSSNGNTNPGGPAYSNNDTSSSSSKAAGLCPQCDGKTGNNYYNCIQRTACALACAPNDPECAKAIPPDPKDATTQDCQMINGEYICGHNGKNYKDTEGKKPTGSSTPTYSNNDNSYNSQSSKKCQAHGSQLENGNDCAELSTSDYISSTSSSTCDISDIICLLNQIPGYSNNDTSSVSSRNDRDNRNDNGGHGYRDPRDGKIYSDKEGTKECHGKCDGSDGDVERT